MTVFVDILQTTILSSILTLFVIMIRPLARRWQSYSFMAVLWGLVFASFMFSLVIPMRMFIQPPDFMNTANFAEAIMNSGESTTSVIMYDRISNRDFGILAQSIWFFGMVLLACYCLIQGIRLNRYFADAELFNDGKYNVLFNDIKRNVKLYTSARVKTPITYGVFKPKIILPAGFSFADDTLAEHAILHESCHIRHLDSLFNILWLSLICVHWFNPLVWICRMLIKDDMEFRCDVAVVKSVGYNNKADYARTLLELTPVQNMPLAFSMPLSASNTRVRIINIMRLHKFTRLSRMLTVILAMFMLPLFCVSLSASMTRFGGFESVDGEYVVFRRNHTLELVGFLDTPPEDVAFYPMGFGIGSMNPNYSVSFVFESAELATDGEQFMIIKKSSFEHSDSGLSDVEAIELIIRNSRRGFWSFSTYISE